MTRAEVFQLIEGERAYQNTLPHHSHLQDEYTPVAAWIIYLEQHIANAKAQIYKMDEMKALDEVRKVAALAVACMEHNETKPRI